MAQCGTATLERGTRGGELPREAGTRYTPGVSAERRLQAIWLGSVGHFLRTADQGTSPRNHETALYLISGDEAEL